MFFGLYVVLPPLMAPPPSSGGGGMRMNQEGPTALLCQHRILLPENFHEGEVILYFVYQGLRFSTPATVLHCELVTESKMGDIVASL